jgi:ferredoxin
MSTEIYYFSGTGNSLFIARELERRIPDSRLLPIVSLVRNDTVKTRGEAVGFVFPVHALTIPIVVKQFIEKADLSPAGYVFAVATRFGTVFRGFEKMDRLLREKGKTLHAGFIVNMASNECRHPGYIVPTGSDISALEAKALEKMALVEDAVKNRRTHRRQDTEFTIPQDTFGDRIAEKLVLAGMAAAEHIGGVNYFYADGKCTGCGVCEKTCLSKKIRMADGRPVWQRDVLCYMCFACLNYCPQQSVQIHDIPGVKSCTRLNGRYPHPYATAKEIAAQKEP